MRTGSTGLPGPSSGPRPTSSGAFPGWSSTAQGPSGTPVWERDWDVLVVLDACRVDLLRSVAEEYPFLGEPDAVGTHRSVASKSDDWLRRTFSAGYEDAIRETAYVTGNPFTAKVQLAVEPAVLDEVWRYGWDEDLSTIPARPITDRAIATWRAGEVSRMIVHCMQPHGPFVRHPELGTYGDPADFGEDLEVLLDSLAADRVVTSADHGNAVGEFGVYGHPRDMLLPSIRTVPWVATSGRDTGEYRPATERDPGENRAPGADPEASRTGVDDRLHHLGYLD